MFKTFKKALKDFLAIKESFLICEETKFHNVVNETTNSFSVIMVQRIADIKVREDIIFSDLKTINDAEKYLEVYKKALGKKKAAGVVVIKEV